MKNIKIIGIKISYKDPIKIISEITKLDENRNHFLRRLIFTPNSEMISSAYNNHQFKKILNKSYLNIPDGYGVVWASWIMFLFNKINKNELIKSRLSGIDLLIKVVPIIAQKKLKIYFLGAKPGVARQAAEILKKRIKKDGAELSVKVDSGPKNISDASPQQIKKIISKINHYSPHFLFVGFGHSKQEEFLYHNQNQLNFDYAVGVGGAFDMISGLIPRAPRFIQNIGFEWLWRLIMEPSRWNRQLKIFYFPILVFRELLKVRVKRR